MALDREQVAKIAYLGRLSLTESELNQMTGQLGSIVDLIGQLNEVETSQVEPMVHAIELENVLAKDVVKPSLHAKACWRMHPIATKNVFALRPCGIRNPKFR